MATIESPIGSVVSTQNQHMKKYVVDDGQEVSGPVVNPHYKPPQKQEFASTDLSEKEIYEKYQAAKNEKAQISPDRKKKIECLLGLRRIVRSINIDGLNISLRNLNANDSRLAMKTIAEKSTTQIDLAFYSRNVYLALSLYELDGENISNLLGEEDVNIELRLSVIEEMSEDVVKQLHEFYQKEIGINLPQTVEENTEVNSEIKK